METATLLATKWPPVTAHELAIIERTAQRDGEETVNAELLSLVRARKALMDACLMCAAAKRITAKPEVKEALAACAALAAQAHDAFPLTIVQGVKNRPRPPIMQP